MLLQPDEALEQALGQVVGELTIEWRKDIERVGAEYRAVIAEMRSEVTLFKAELKERAEQEFARMVEAVAKLRDGAPGKDGEPGPAGERGLQGEAGVQGEKGEVGPEGQPGPVGERGLQGEAGAQGEKGEAGPEGKPGRDADPDIVAVMVLEEVSRQVAQIELPRGEKGEPGEIGPEGSPGPAADPEQIAGFVAEAVQKAVSALSIPKGEKGEPGERGDVGPPGRDGAGLVAAMIDRSGNLVLTLTDGSTKEVGLVVGRDGLAGERGLNGKDGRDGLSFESFAFEIEYDGERTFALKWSDAAGAMQSREFSLPFPIDRGVYKEGIDYARGDSVSFGGSLFIAQVATTDRPETSKAWRLSTKKGRNGKDGVVKHESAPKPVKVV